MSNVENLQVNGISYPIRDKNTLRSLSSDRYNEVITYGKYNNEDVDIGEVFTNEEGKFQKFSKSEKPSETSFSEKVEFTPNGKDTQSPFWITKIVKEINGESHDFYMAIGSVTDDWGNIVSKSFTSLDGVEWDPTNPLTPSGDPGVSADSDCTPYYNNGYWIVRNSFGNNSYSNDDGKTWGVLSSYNDPLFSGDYGVAGEYFFCTNGSLWLSTTGHDWNQYSISGASSLTYNPDENIYVLLANGKIYTNENPLESSWEEVTVETALWGSIRRIRYINGTYYILSNGYGPDWNEKQLVSKSINLVNWTPSETYIPDNGWFDGHLLFVMDNVTHNEVVLVERSNGEIYISKNKGQTFELLTTGNGFTSIVDNELLQIYDNEIYSLNPVPSWEYKLEDVGSLTDIAESGTGILFNSYIHDYTKEGNVVITDEDVIDATNVELTLINNVYKKLPNLIDTTKDFTFKTKLTMNQGAPAALVSFVKTNSSTGDREVLLLESQGEGHLHLYSNSTSGLNEAEWDISDFTSGQGQRDIDDYKLIDCYLKITWKAPTSGEDGVLKVSLSDDDENYVDDITITTSSTLANFNKIVIGSSSLHSYDAEYGDNYYYTGYIYLTDTSLNGYIFTNRALTTTTDIEWNASIYSNKTIISGSDMIGATSSNNGSFGDVPTPLAGDNTKFLCGDGTWSNDVLTRIASAGNGIEFKNAINGDFEVGGNLEISDDGIAYNYTDKAIIKLPQFSIYLRNLEHRFIIKYTHKTKTNEENGQNVYCIYHGDNSYNIFVDSADCLTIWDGISSHQFIGSYQLVPDTTYWIVGKYDLSSTTFYVLEDDNYEYYDDLPSEEDFTTLGELSGYVFPGANVTLGNNIYKNDMYNKSHHIAGSIDLNQTVLINDYAGGTEWYADVYPSDTKYVISTSVKSGNNAPNSSVIGYKGEVYIVNGSDAYICVDDSNTWRKITYAPSSTTISLYSSNWQNKEYTIPVVGMTTSTIVWLAPSVSADNSNEELYATYGIRVKQQNNGSIVLGCTSEPPSDINVELIM